MRPPSEPESQPPGNAFQQRVARLQGAAHTARVDRLGRAENLACGDQLELSLQLDGQRIEHAGFLARGCSSLLASAALVCEALTGQELAQAARFDCEAFLLSTGGPPPRGMHAVVVVERALRAALAKPKA